MPAITIDAAATALNRHQIKYDKVINQKLKLGMKMEAALTKVKAKHTFTAPNVEIQSVVQAYQGGFTPNLSAAFKAVDIKLQRMKVDIQFAPEDIDLFFDSWMAEWVEDGKPKELYTFPRYIYEEVVMPQIEADMAALIYKGVRVEPLAGTAGNMIDSVDGYGKIIADAITATLLTPITTGAIVQGTAVNQIETFADQLPVEIRDAPGEFKMSTTNARKFWRNYRDQFGTGNGVLGNSNNELRVDATNKKIVGYPEMEGSDRIIFTPKNNMVVVRREGDAPMPRIRWQEDERFLKGLAEFSRGYGFKFFGNTYVNDAA